MGQGYLCGFSCGMMESGYQGLLRGTVRPLRQLLEQSIPRSGQGYLGREVTQGHLSGVIRQWGLVKAHGDRPVYGGCSGSPRM